VLHDPSLGEPDEAAGRVVALVGVERALEHVDAVGARGVRTRSSSGCPTTGTSLTRRSTLSR
jgi:hypothetical protein